MKCVTVYIILQKLVLIVGWQNQLPLEAGRMASWGPDDLGSCDIAAQGIYSQGYGQGGRAD